MYESYERGWLKQIPEAEEGHLKMGEWNKMRIRVDGDHVQTWLNGHAMVDFKDEKIAARTLALLPCKSTTAAVSRYAGVTFC